MKLFKILLLSFVIIGCNETSPMDSNVSSQKQQVAVVDSLIVSTEELGLKSNFTIHEEAIDELGAENWLLVNITGINNVVILGLSFATDSLFFHFVRDSVSIDYDLVFAYPRLIPPPSGTIFETFSPENKDDPITERFVYYIANK